MFKKIYLINFDRTLSDRANSRKYSSGYHIYPLETPADSIYFYDGDSFVGCGLRIEPANDLLPGFDSLSQTEGYYTEFEEYSETMKPIVARLPRGRGFLAGWTMGEGMTAWLNRRVFTCEIDAARAAHDFADYDASESREYSQCWYEATNATTKAHERALSVKDVLQVCRTMKRSNISESEYKEAMGLIFSPVWQEYRAAIAGRQEALLTVSDHGIAYSDTICY